MHVATNPIAAERKGKTLHLLKNKSKAAGMARKRKHYEVFDPGMPNDVLMVEEVKEE